MRNLKVSLIAGLSVIVSLQAQARRGGDGQGRNRPETISCGLLFAGATQPVGTQSALVQQAQAVLRGDAEGVSYVFSVRGKTAVARLTDGVQVVTAQGAIEMLRRGGEADPATFIQPLRKGEDDANDGAPEREAGFQLAIASAGAPNRPKVVLKCESVNQTETDRGEQP